MPVIAYLPKPYQLDTGSNLRAGAKAYWYVTNTSTPKNTYSDFAMTTPNTNPVIADANGIFPVMFLATDQRYRITLRDSADALIYTQDDIAGPVVTQADVGAALYPQTAAELAAGVTPTNYAYQPGDIRRYGAVIDGSTDDRTAIMNAYAQFKQTGGANLILPAGTSYVSKNGSNVYALNFDGDVVLNGNGKFRLLGHASTDYTLLYVTGGTNVKIDVRGVTFDNNKSSPNRPSDNDDIGLRIESSVDTVNVENCDFKNYDEDGIYFRATVNGVGGRIHHNRFANGARSGVTLVKGQYVSIEHNNITTCQLNSITVQPVDSSTVCRQISVDYNRIIGGGTDTNSGSDRAAIFISHVNGASASNMGQYTCRGNVIKDFGSGYSGGAFAFGIEIRELTDCIIEGNEVTGAKHAGLYAYLTTRAAFIGNLSCSNDKGLWMNSCTDYSDIGNTCANNTTKDRDYHGPDGATTYLQADGLNAIIARGSVSFSGGTPSLNSSYNITTVTDLGVGDTKFTFTRAPGTANYSVSPDFRGFSGTAGVIQSASHNTTDFRVITLKAGVAADENYDFIVFGPMSSTTEPP